MTKLIILGCGSSVGSPWTTNNWGKCDKKNKFNIVIFNFFLLAI